MSDNCENSTDREFEDYFRKEQPADLIPRLENVLERLDGDEQELAVAGEIVNYVITQLESMDEDTAGEVSEKSVECDRCGWQGHEADALLRKNDTGYHDVICPECRYIVHWVREEDTAEEREGARLSEEYRGLNGSEILEKVREERSVITGSEDEDTAGDDSYGDRVSSEGEKRDTCDNGHCNGGPSPAASENTLEPAAWLKKWKAWYNDEEIFHTASVNKEFDRDDVEEIVAKEPLVRPDQLFDRLMRIVEEHRHRAEDASAAGNEKERYACESVADVIYDEVMQWKLQIKEFTQGEPSE